jgi:chitinase
MKFIRFWLSLGALFVFGTGAEKAQSQQVIGYIAAHDHLLQARDIPARKLTRIQYAFVYPVDGEVNDTLPVDAANLTTLVSLKHVAPNLQVVVSIGGASHSGAFSDISLTEESRSRFAASCLRLVEKYNLDGVDIDWEYPASPRPDGHFRAEDKHNYTLLMRALRQSFDAAEPQLKKHLITSTATNGKAFFLRSTEMGEVAKYVDTVNLMGYDFFGPGANTTGNHSALFTDPADPRAVSDDQCVEAYIAAGVPAEKIVLGVPFYGHGWNDVSALNHGLFQPNIHNTGFDIAYSDIVAKDLDPHSGFVRYWDRASAVPWLYNEKTGVFISYDDPISLAQKAVYARTRHLGGIMFWSLNADSGDALIDAINAGLGRTP